ncbi:MAG: valine--tRNA ligase [Ruminococcus sp.]|jgi:valyl-tRNA synthetase|nr:valine--tRNA ligase [Ruminococcus sp.]
MIKQMPKAYEPKNIEDKIYKRWEDGKAFAASRDKNKKPYTIVIPPPNVTGQLHMGHAFDCTLQDILIRYKRMSGYAALWVPGTDHAALATEVKIVEQLKKEGTSKEAMGREKFLERAWEWKETYADRIISQLKKMGSSCDWDRLRFTMDEGCNKAVKAFFIKLYNKGLIYRGERMINWCTNCKTSLSDAEVDHEEMDGSFWHIRYQIKDSTDFIEIATTRPETMLGDTAVAVNPDDPRYTDIIGKTVILPLVNREIPVVADDYVKTDFGTGIVKITPAHDPNDFEVGKRHNLPIISMMNDDGTVSSQFADYAGMDRYDARKKIVEDLKAGGYLVKIETHSHNVGTCSRCKSVVEPKISTQWFVKMKPLAEPAIEAVKNGDTKFIPSRFDKIYFHWLENINDWCISRQIWWGHRIPAFYCDSCGDIIVTDGDSAVCPKCGKPCRQDEDTLDTWFSSALWPFSTLGWPDKTPDFEYFYPTSTLVTGYDIIFFWVIRMIFSALELTGEVPFDTVLIHGLVRDEQGRKMSKSLGNGIDPLEVVEDYSADALRYMLVSGNGAGNDMRFDEKKLVSAAGFANKLWNASRYLLMNLPEGFTPTGLPENLTLADRWVISKLNSVTKDINDNLDKFELGIAATNICDFIWDIYCDWYIEVTKPRLQSENKTDVLNVLFYCLENILKLLHPFMPFITEEIWSHLHDGFIMLESYPVYDECRNFKSDEEQFEKIIEGVKAIRAKRAEMNIPPSVKANLFIETNEGQLFADNAETLMKLAFASSVNTFEKFDDIDGKVTAVTSDAKIFIPIGDLIDKEKEIERLKKELAKIQKDIDFSSGKLSNAGFIAKAPAAQVEAERKKLSEAEVKMSKINESIQSLSSIST